MAASPGPGEDFRFRHILIQDAAYRATPKSLRAELHERFADWIEERARTGSPSIRVAGYHLEQAFRYRAELAPVGERELELAHRASDRLAFAGHPAFQRGDMPATVNLLGRAAALPTPTGGAAWPRYPTRLRALRDRRGRGGEHPAGRARRNVRTPKAIASRMARDVTRPRIEMYKDPGAIDLDALTAESETAIEALNEFGDDTGLARASMVLSDIHWMKGGCARPSKPRPERRIMRGASETGARSAGRWDKTPSVRFTARCRSPRVWSGSSGRSEASRRTAPSMRTCWFRHPAGGDERTIRRGPRHITIAGPWRGTWA